MYNFYDDLSKYQDTGSEYAPKQTFGDINRSSTPEFQADLQEYDQTIPSSVGMLQAFAQGKMKQEQQQVDDPNKPMATKLAESGQQNILDQIGGVLESAPSASLIQGQNAPTNVPVTQGFGAYNPAIEKFSGGINRGTDFGVNENTNLYAPQGKWKVIEAYNKGGMNNGYGNSVKMVNQETGEVIRVSHLNRVNVREGQTLNGEQIGLSGQTGNTTGPHADIEYFDQSGKLKDVLTTNYAKEVIGSPKIGSNEIPQPESSMLLDAIPMNKRRSAKQTISLVEQALKEEGIYSPEVMSYAMATIEHETGGTFDPIEEFGGRQQARKLGYDGGENYYGRGYIQLTHLSNYRDIGNRIGVPELANKPQLALQPEIAAKILAAFFKDRGVAEVAGKGDFYNARVPVNGYDKAGLIQQMANKYYNYFK